MEHTEILLTFFSPNLWVFSIKFGKIYFGKFILSRLILIIAVAKHVIVFTTSLRNIIMRSKEFVDLILTLDQGGTGCRGPRVDTLVDCILAVANCPSLFLARRDLRRSREERGFQRLDARCKIVDGGLKIRSRPCRGSLPTTSKISTIACRASGWWLKWHGELYWFGHEGPMSSVVLCIQAQVRSRGYKLVGRGSTVPSPWVCVCDSSACRLAHASVSVCSSVTTALSSPFIVVRGDERER